MIEGEHPGEYRAAHPGQLIGNPKGCIPQRADLPGTAPRDLKNIRVIEVKRRFESGRVQKNRGKDRQRKKQPHRRFASSAIDIVTSLAIGAR